MPMPPRPVPRKMQPFRQQQSQALRPAVQPAMQQPMQRPMQQRAQPMQSMQQPMQQQMMQKSPMVQRPQAVQPTQNKPMPFRAGPQQMPPRGTGPFVPSPIGGQGTYIPGTNAAGMPSQPGGGGVMKMPETGGLEPAPGGGFGMPGQTIPGTNNNGTQYGSQPPLDLGGGRTPEWGPDAPWRKPYNPNAAPIYDVNGVEIPRQANTSGNELASTGQQGMPKYDPRGIPGGGYSGGIAGPSREEMDRARAEEAKIYGPGGLKDQARQSGGLPPGGWGGYDPFRGDPTGGLKGSAIPLGATNPDGSPLTTEAIEVIRNSFNAIPLSHDTKIGVLMLSLVFIVMGIMVVAVPFTSKVAEVVR